MVAVAVMVGVRVSVGVGVMVGVSVTVGVTVSVNVGVCDGVAVSVAVVVGEGVGEENKASALWQPVSVRSKGMAKSQAANLSRSILDGR